jgi:hypothetical protein
MSQVKQLESTCATMHVAAWLVNCIQLSCSLLLCSADAHAVTKPGYRLASTSPGAAVLEATQTARLCEPDRYNIGKLPAAPHFITNIVCFAILLLKGAGVPILRAVCKVQRFQGFVAEACRRRWVDTPSVGADNPVGILHLRKVNLLRCFQLLAAV